MLIVDRVCTAAVALLSLKCLGPAHDTRATHRADLHAKFDALPVRVHEALGVLADLTAEEVDDVVGPKGRHDAAVRHGHEAGAVTLGGRRVPVARPRVRSRDGCEEVSLATYAHFADRDPLTAVVLEQISRASARAFPDHVGCLYVRSLVPHCRARKPAYSPSWRTPLRVRSRL